jgi:H/ACA ribonucleoprotein complex subunit 3
MKLRKCCTYTLKERCPVCGAGTKTAHPPKFSAQDKYGRYRRMAKKKPKAVISI